MRRVSSIRNPRQSGCAVERQTRRILRITAQSQFELVRELENRLNTSRRSAELFPVNGTKPLSVTLRRPANSTRLEFWRLLPARKHRVVWGAQRSPQSEFRDANIGFRLLDVKLFCSSASQIAPCKESSSGWSVVADAR